MSPRNLRIPILLFALATPPSLQAAVDDPGFVGLGIRGTSQGVRVNLVFPGSGADLAGLHEGDLLVSADDATLVGLSTKDAIALLKGPLDSTVVLEVDVFPPGGQTRSIEVVRGPRPAETEKAKGFLQPVEREANVVVGALRSGRSVPWETAVRTWSQAENPADAERALLRVLRDSDATGWARSIAGPERQWFWQQLNDSSELRVWLAERSAATRLRAASYLARHAETAEMALELLDDLSSSQLRVATEQLASSVRSADAERCASQAMPTWDLWSEDGWSVHMDPQPGQLAALELLLDATVVGAHQVPPVGLETGAVRSLEHSGMRLPWEVEHQVTPKGRVEAPVVQPFQAAIPDGGVLDLAGHHGPVVLAFWATWCGPCRNELPKLQQLRERYLDQGLEVWALSTDKAGSEQAVAELWEELHLELPLAFAPSDLVRGWQVSSVPRTMLLDAEHRLVIDHQGFSNQGFAAFEKELAQVVEGERSGLRTLGESWGDPTRWQVLGTGTLEAGPRALVADLQGRVWAAFAERLTLLALEEGTIAPVESSAIPLPFAADLVLQADLDDDGEPEWLLARAGKLPLRAARADGSTLWTQRDPDSIGGLGLHRDASGALRVAVLRTGHAMVAPPNNARGLAPGQQVPIPRQRLELLDAGGQLMATVPIPSPVVDMAWSQGDGRLVLALADARVVELTAGGELVELEHPMERVKGVRLLDLGAQEPELVLAGRGLRQVLAGDARDGEHWMVGMTSGGDLLRLEPEQPGLPPRLELERRPSIVSGDLDGDGLDELVLWARWFGMAAIQPGE